MPFSKFTKMKMTGLNVVIPDYPRSIDEDIAEFDHDQAKLARAKKVVGYGTRYSCPPGLTPADLALAAAESLIEDLGLDRAGIEALVCVTQKPDFTQPGSSFFLHHRLGLAKNCACLDLNQGCSGFVYGLWLAGSLLESGAVRRVLLLTADYCPPDGQARNRLLFGAAGAAAWLEYDEAAPESFFSLGADGGGYEDIIIPAGGARLPIQADVLGLTIEDRQGGRTNLIDGYIDGLEVFNFSVREVPPNVRGLLDYAGLEAEDVAFAAFHQANKQIVDSIAAKSGLAKEQYSTRTFSEYGNQSSVSVPGVLAHILAERAARERLKVLLCGYGIGAAWASCLTDLDHIHCRLIKRKFDDLRSREEEIAYWVRRISQGK